MNELREWSKDISIALIILGFFGLMIYAPLVFS